MKFNGATASHVGNIRSTNQDRAFFSGSVAAVADGMGGHLGGEKAAELAIGEFLLDLQTTDHLSLDSDQLVKLLEEANREVHRQSSHPELTGMGTTMVALGLHRDQIVIANVGDSRAYQLRDGRLLQLTVDHSFVEELVRQGRLTAEEAAVHPQRNIVTRAIGIGPAVEVDTFTVEPLLGDRYLLASDGLFSEVPEPAIRQILAAGESPTITSSALIEAALATPCRDNVTVAVVDVVGDDFEVPYTEPTPEISPPAQRKPKQEITAEVPIVDPGVHRITDRPDGHVASTAHDNGRTAVMARPVESDPVEQYVRSEVQSEVPKTQKRRSGSLGAILGAAILLVGIAAAGFLGVEWRGNRGYSLGVVDESVQIFKGRPGGFLWVDERPVAEPQAVPLAELSEQARQSVLDRPTFSSATEAQQALDNLERASIVSTPDDGNSGSEASNQESSGASGKVGASTTTGAATSTTTGATTVTTRATTGASTTRTTAEG